MIAAPRFDGERAQEWIVEQCSYGPRVPGSEGHVRWLARQQEVLRSLGVPYRADHFRLESPHFGPDSLDLCNILASIRPGIRPRLLIGAHFDTRPWADMDPDSSRHQEPILGANDGGSGIAVLLELARILSENPPPIGVDFAFFDAEDFGRSGHPEEYCRGSQRMADTWSGPLPDYVLVLDMVGAVDMVLGRELYAWSSAPEWSALVFEVARQKGFQEWDPDLGYYVIDDHLSFLSRGVPSTVLIGFQDPRWHTHRDLPEWTSPRSLERVGEVVLSLIYDGYLSR